MDVSHVTTPGYLRLHSHARPDCHRPGKIQEDQHQQGRVHMRKILGHYIHNV